MVMHRFDVSDFCFIDFSSQVHYKTLNYFAVTIKLSIQIYKLKCMHAIFKKKKKNSNHQTIPFNKNYTILYYYYYNNNFIKPAIIKNVL